jgi:hypothetical protein
LLLYHPITKTYNHFKNVYQYQFDGDYGELIETDKKLRQGQIIILKGISEFAIIVEKVWEENGKHFFTHSSAEEVIVRARSPKDSTE